MFAEYTVSCWHLTFAFFKVFFSFSMQKGNYLFVFVTGLQGKPNFVIAILFFCFPVFHSYLFIFGKGNGKIFIKSMLS